MNSCNFTNKANLHTPKVEIHTGQNYPILVAICCENKAIWSKKFRPGYPGLSIRMGEFSFWLPRSRSQTEISVTRPARLLI